MAPRPRISTRTARLPAQTARAMSMLQPLSSSLSLRCSLQRAAVVRSIYTCVAEATLTQLLLQTKTLTFMAPSTSCQRRDLPAGPWSRMNKNTWILVNLAQCSRTRTASSSSSLTRTRTRRRRSVLLCLPPRGVPKDWTMSGGLRHRQSASKGRRKCHRPLLLPSPPSLQTLRQNQTEREMSALS